MSRFRQLLFDRRDVVILILSRGATQPQPALGATLIGCSYRGFHELVYLKPLCAGLLRRSEGTMSTATLATGADGQTDSPQSSAHPTPVAAGTQGATHQPAVVGSVHLPPDSSGKPQPEDGVGARAQPQRAAGAAQTTVDASNTTRTPPSPRVGPRRRRRRKKRRPSSGSVGSVGSVGSGSGLSSVGLGSVGERGVPVHADAAGGLPASSVSYVHDADLDRRRATLAQLLSSRQSMQELRAANIIPDPGRAEERRRREQTLDKFLKQKLRKQNGTDARGVRMSGLRDRSEYCGCGYCCVCQCASVPVRACCAACSRPCAQCRTPTSWTDL